MKINQLIPTSIFFTWLLSASIDAPAQSKKLIYEGLRQGTSWSVYLLNKEPVKQIERGGETKQLYVVNLETDSSYDGISQQTNIVQCSTSQPFIAFKDDYDTAMAIVHYINPGGEMYGYNTASNWIYWAVCHDLYSPWDYDLTSKATQLGYSTELGSQQVEMPYVLLQYLE